MSECGCHALPPDGCVAPPGKSTGTVDCRVCLGDHDPEVHDATERVRRWFRGEVLHTNPPDPLGPVCRLGLSKSLTAGCERPAPSQISDKSVKRRKKR